MVNMSWIMEFKKNRISNIEEADGSGDSWNCLVKLWELAAHNPVEIEGIAYDIDSFEGMAYDTDNLEGIIEIDEDLEGKVGVTN